MGVSVSVLKNQNQEVKDVLPAWKRINVLVEEDEKSYADPLYFTSFPNEDAQEKQNRKTNYVNGFYNPSQDLINASGEYILRQSITRTSTSAEIEAFFSSADRSGQSLNDFVKNQISPNLTAYGTVFAVVDKPRAVAQTKAEEMATGMPYLCVLNPLQVLDWAYAESGDLEWFRYCQGSQQDRANPFGDIPSSSLEYVTWTRNDYYRHDNGGNEIESFTHNFGIVPVAIQAAFLIDANKTIGKSTFFSGSRQIFMGNSLLSKANQEILKYGSVLLMSTMDIDPRQRERDLDPLTNLPMLNSKTADGNVLSTGDMANPPSYLEKDISVVDKANGQAQKYFEWAAHGEATGQTAMPLQDAQAAPQSGVAKAYDFKDVDANLHAKAQDLQAMEEQIVSIVANELGIKNPVFSIKYPTSFDVDSFEDKIAQVADLARISFASETGKKIAMKRITNELTQDDKERSIINDEIDLSKPPEVVTTKPAFG